MDAFCNPFSTLVYSYTQIVLKFLLILSQKWPTEPNFVHPVIFYLKLWKLLVFCHKTNNSALQISVRIWTCLTFISWKLEKSYPPIFTEFLWVLNIWGQYPGVHRINVTNCICNRRSHEKTFFLRLSHLFSTFPRQSRKRWAGIRKKCVTHSITYHGICSYSNFKSNYYKQP